MTFAIRVDSSTRIGTGHLIRCLTLARVLKSRGEDAVFLCRHLEGNVTNQLESAGFEVLYLEIDQVGKDTLQNQDAMESLQLIRDRSANRVILDHYDLSLDWEELIGRQVDDLTVIDDFTHRQHHCDLLLNQNLVPPNDKSYSISPHGAALALIGPKYALLQHEYAQLRSVRSVESSEIERISVFMGGSDPDNVTELTLRSLINMDIKDIAIDVVIGSANPHRTQLLSRFGDNQSITFHSDLSSLASLFSKCDLAIGAGGTTNWERMCLGVPSIVLDIAENQSEICTELARAGLIEHLGSSHTISPINIQDAVEKLHSNVLLRNQYSRKGQVTVDGLGANRVAEVLIPSDQESLLLRKSRLGDISLYFNWVNEYKVRQSSLNSEPISWPEHEAWFLSRINSPSCRMYVICANNIPIGQVRFEKSGETWTIDYSLDEFVRGRGWGKILVKQAIDEFKKSTMGKVVAYVKTSNFASRQIFQELDFSANAQSAAGTDQFELTI